MEDKKVVNKPSYITKEIWGPEKRSGNICFVAGRSGGHIVPCLTQAAQIKKRYPHFSITLFTTTHALDMNIAQQCSVPIAHIPLSLGSVPGKNPFKLLWFTVQLLYSFLKSLFMLKRNRVDRIVTTGSYVAIPVCLAAWILKIPIELHVLDIVPGKALLFLAPFAQSISLCFPESERYFLKYKHRCYSASYPIRFERLQITPMATLGDPTINPKLRSTSVGGPGERAQSRFTSIGDHTTPFIKNGNSVRGVPDRNVSVDWGYHGECSTAKSNHSNDRFQKSAKEQSNTKDSFILLILGGSQGSDYLNKLALEWVKKYGIQMKNRLHVVHQTGANKSCEIDQQYKELGIQATVFDYNNDLGQFLANADLVICRSGAGTLFEIDFFKIPCITIPLVTKTTAHQVDNARSFATRFPERFMYLEQQENLKLMSEQLNRMIQKEN